MSQVSEATVLPLPPAGVPQHLTLTGAFSFKAYSAHETGEQSEAVERQ